MADVFCNQCGHRNPPGSNFCSSCGAVLAHPGEDTTITFLPEALSGEGATDEELTVSRRHAEVVRGDDGYRVKDVGSLNGTYLNRERIDEAPLASGDEVQIGKFKLVFFSAEAG